MSSPWRGEAPRPSPSQAILRYFEFEHLADGPPRLASETVHDLAREMELMLPDGPEKTAGLRKLLEAKDCFVRAALDIPKAAS